MFLSAPPLHILHLYLTWPNYPNRCNYYYIQYMYTTSHIMNIYSKCFYQLHPTLISHLGLIILIGVNIITCIHMYTPVYVCVYMYYPIHVYTCIHLCIYNTNLTLLTTCHTYIRVVNIYQQKAIVYNTYTHLLQFTCVKCIVYLSVL